MSKSKQALCLIAALFAAVGVASAQDSKLGVGRPATPEEIKATAPWLSDKELNEAIDGAKTGTPEATRNLQQAGASVLPPFHPLCRTVPVIID